MTGMFSVVVKSFGTYTRSFTVPEDATPGDLLKLVVKWGFKEFDLTFSRLCFGPMPMKDLLDVNQPCRSLQEHGLVDGSICWLVWDRHIARLLGGAGEEELSPQVSEDA